jgi:predicted CxxxxCH...CXXCH cytochrome family protein
MLSEKYRQNLLGMDGKKKMNAKSESGFTVLWQTVPAIDRSSFGWLERNFALFTTVCTNSLCHFPGTEVFRAAKTFSFHWITLAGETCKERITSQVYKNLHGNYNFFYI